MFLNELKLDEALRRAEQTESVGRREDRVEDVSSLSGRFGSRFKLVASSVGLVFLAVGCGAALKPHQEAELFRKLKPGALKQFCVSGEGEQVSGCLLDEEGAPAVLVVGCAEGPKGHNDKAAMAALKAEALKTGNFVEGPDGEDDGDGNDVKGGVYSQGWVTTEGVLDSDAEEAEMIKSYSEDMLDLQVACFAFPVNGFWKGETCEQDVEDPRWFGFGLVN
ncbi:hypothetical protein HOE67_04675 [Candidatus Peregrinibacteria bacterium]|nr:hypothetical protein [Candidatus Peregrinibacteria bacterium]MBT4056376.1 hypothetical protein [Candidatus Peregrinibacteria bacterium]